MSRMREGQKVSHKASHKISWLTALGLLSLGLGLLSSFLETNLNPIFSDAEKAKKEIHTEIALSQRYLAQVSADIARDVKSEIYPSFKEGESLQNISLTQGQKNLLNRYLFSQHLSRIQLFETSSCLALHRNVLKEYGNLPYGDCRSLSSFLSKSNTSVFQWSWHEDGQNLIGSLNLIRLLSFEEEGKGREFVVVLTNYIDRSWFRSGQLSRMGLDLKVSVEPLTELSDGNQTEALNQARQPAQTLFVHKVFYHDPQHSTAVLRIELDSQILSSFPKPLIRLYEVAYFKKQRLSLIFYAFGFLVLVFFSFMRLQRLHQIGAKKIKQLEKSLDQTQKNFEEWTSRASEAEKKADEWKTQSHVLKEMNQRNRHYHSYHFLVTHIQKALHMQWREIVFDLRRSFDQDVHPFWQEADRQLAVIHKLREFWISNIEKMGARKFLRTLSERPAQQADAPEASTQLDEALAEIFQILEEQQLFNLHFMPGYKKKMELFFPLMEKITFYQDLLSLWMQGVLKGYLPQTKLPLRQVLNQSFELFCLSRGLKTAECSLQCSQSPSWEKDSSVDSNSSSVSGVYVLESACVLQMWRAFDGLWNSSNRIALRYKYILKDPNQWVLTITTLDGSYNRESAIKEKSFEKSLKDSLQDLLDVSLDFIEPDMTQAKSGLSVGDNPRSLPQRSAVLMGCVQSLSHFKKSSKSRSPSLGQDLYL